MPSGVPDAPAVVIDVRVGGLALAHARAFADELGIVEVEVVELGSLAVGYDLHRGVVIVEDAVRLRLAVLLRLPEVAESVSQVAQIPAVRAFMKKLTLELVAASSLPGVVVEGRDITTVVAPEAPVRILLTAREDIRLERRSKELTSDQLSTLKAQLHDRDAKDSKVVDFMKPADGVTLVDSSNLNFEQTVDAVLSIIREQ